MRKLLLVLFLVTSFGYSYAQQGIRVCVLDKKSSKPVTGVIVTLHSIGEMAILTSGMTAADGCFVLKYDLMPDSVTVLVRSMTIESQSKNTKRGVGFIEFLVEEKMTELKEVIIQTPKIRQLGDTIHYNVASFMDETDRSIGDVLKKLPGIQVLSTGQILYQNKEISKFYVEGLDLLQGKYGIATNNIDAGQVASVQVLENHQPIKALKDTEIPGAAAINLKLKQSAIGAFFATAQLGVGLPPMLLSNELVAMRFTRTQQNMLVYKGDNTGRDIAQALTSFYNNRFNVPQNYLSVQIPMLPPIQGQHCLFNDAHLFSLNDLRTLKKDFTLTGNLNYLYDQQKSSSFSQQDVFIEQGEAVQIMEDLRSRLTKRELEGNLTLEKNTEQNFIENKLHVSSKWNDQYGNVWTSENISQLLKTPSFKVENNFNYIRRKNGKQFRAGSDISYLKQDHSLRITPILFNDFSVAFPADTTVRQNVSNNQFKANFYVAGGREINKFSLNCQLSAFANLQDMQSGIIIGENALPILMDTLRNQMGRNESGVELIPSIHYRPCTQTQFYSDFPIRLLYLNRQDIIRNTKQNEGFIFFSPRIGLQHTLTARTLLNTNFSFTNNIGSMREDYLGYIMNTYRSLSRNDGAMSKNRYTSAYASLNYRNPFTTLFSTLSFSYSNFWLNLLYDVRYNGILNYIVAVQYPNHSNTYSTHFTLGQNVDAIHSEIRLAGGYNRNNSIALNQGIIARFSANAYSVSPSIRTNIGRSVITQYSASYRHINNKIEDHKMSPIHNLTQNVNISVIPLKGLVFNLTFNHYYNNLIESQARSSWFGNTSIKYKLKNADLMLDWTNIFNTNRFVTYRYNDVSSFYFVYDLRPTEVLLRVRFKIL